MLGRLVRLGYLSRVGRRATGSKGGAGAYVYQLGRAGRLLLDVERRLSPNVNNHALMMVDTYLELRRAEKVGLLTVADWEVERRVPPSVRADLYVSLDFPSQGRSSSFFLEIDLSTEQPARIREKVAGYWRAVEMATADYFPYVVFVVKDLVRRNELTRLFRQLPAEQQGMLKVHQLDNLAEAFVHL
ncbi:replication-relaxation family protein [Streptomyces sp. PvR018]|uniref:replication-relaxation family protein n=1 Tax=Streptomyces sp. PvR018 TaxID=3156442 RepID=UPI0033916EA3